MEFLDPRVAVLGLGVASRDGTSASTSSLRKAAAAR